MTGTSSRAWTWRHAILDSDVSADCRHLLLTLSCFMNELGESCFPTIETIMKKTKRGKTWVHKYLNEAESSGWIGRLSVSRKTKNGDNRGWRRNEYVARWPEETKNTKFQNQSSTEGSSRNELPMRKRSSPECLGSSQCDENVVREANTTSPSNISNNLPSSFDEKRSSEERHWEEKFTELLRKHPGGLKFYSDSWRMAFFALTEEDRERAIKVHSSWLQSLKNVGRNNPPGLKSYFENRLFDEILDEGRPMDIVILEPYSQEWFSHRLWHLAQGPTGQFKPTSFQERMIENGKGAILEADKNRAQYPQVAKLDERAFNGDSVTLSDHEQRIVGVTEKVERGSVQWQAWAAFHHRMGWPWIEPPSSRDFIIMPIALSEIDHGALLDKFQIKVKQK